MMNLYPTVLTEDLKTRRSKLLPITIGASVFLSCMIGLLMFISLHPEYFNNSSLLGTKASFFTTSNWQGYIGVLLQVSAGFDFVLFGFLASWIFGREYSDRTLKDLIALPTSRTTIVISKFIIASLYSLLLALVFFATSVIVALSMGMADLTLTSIIQSFGIYLLTVCMVILLTTPVALVASIGKGYLAPFAYIISTVMVSQFINVGAPLLDPYVPWAVPVIYSMSAMAMTSSFPPLQPVSYLIVIAFSLFGMLGTIHWWNHTDHV